MTRTLVSRVVGCAAIRGSASHKKDRARQRDRQHKESKFGSWEVSSRFHGRRCHLQFSGRALLPLRLRHRLYGAAESHNALASVWELILCSTQLITLPEAKSLHIFSRRRAQWSGA